MLTRRTTKLTARRRDPWVAFGVVIALCVMCAPRVGSATRADAANGFHFRVIVNAHNPMSSATREFVGQAFFKRTTRWENGEIIHPVDLEPDSAVRREFSSDVLQRSLAAVRSYWQQRIFSGRDLPPVELDSEAAVIKYVASSPGAIGYVSTSAPLEGAKELLLRP